jgi:serine/threonine-protein kinase
MNPLRTSVLAVLAAALALAPSSVRADDDVATLLRRGVQLRREHRNAEALDVFARALALSPTPRVRAQVALAEQAVGRWIEAERDLDAALSSDQDPWIAKNRAVLEEARGVVEQRLSWLTVEVATPSAEAELDGQPVPCGVETRVLARSSILKVRAAGYVPEERSVTLQPAQHLQQRFELSAVAPVATVALVAPEAPAAVAPLAPQLQPSLERQAQPSPEPSARTAAPIGPLALGVAGVIGLGVGAYFGIRASDFEKSEEDACVGGACRPAATAAWNDAQSSAEASTIGVGAGLALVSAGAIWWLFSDRNLRKAPHAIRVSPLVGAVTGIAVASDL